MNFSVEQIVFNYKYRFECPSGTSHWNKRAESNVEKKKELQNPKRPLLSHQFMHQSTNFDFLKMSVGVVDDMDRDPKPLYRYPSLSIHATSYHIVRMPRTQQHKKIEHN
jgi:hypothetical protein